MLGVLAAVQQAYLFIPLQMQVLLPCLIELNCTSQLLSILASFVNLFYLQYNTASLQLATYCSNTSDIMPFSIPENVYINSKTSSLCWNLNSEKPGDSKNVFLH